MRYRTQGVCAQFIDYEVENNILHGVKFYGGCNGNGKAVASLIEGMSVDEAIKRLDKIDCGGRGTSCADQLARALKQNNA